MLKTKAKQILDELPIVSSDDNPYQGGSEGMTAFHQNYMGRAKALPLQHSIRRTPPTSYILLPSEMRQFTKNQYKQYFKDKERII